MGSDRNLSNLQLLCSLGLSSEDAVPAVLDSVLPLMDVDTAQCIWVTPQCEPAKICCQNWGESLMSGFLQTWRQMDFPGAANFVSWIRRYDYCYNGGPEDRHYYGSGIYGEVMRHIGGECALAVTVRDSAGNPRASLSVCRDRRTRPFTITECQRLAAVAAHVGALFDPGDYLGPGKTERRVGRGVGLYDLEGRLLYCDEPARQMLQLSGSTYVEEAWEGARHADVLALHIARLCVLLKRRLQGAEAGPARFQHVVPAGRFLFSGRLASAMSDSCAPLVAVEISHYQPLKLALWEKVKALELPPRLQQVCIEFAAGASMTDVASRLGLSRHTVIDYVGNLYSRFGIAPGRETLLSHVLGGE